jgi:hypothetical protein
LSTLQSAEMLLDGSAASSVAAFSSELFQLDDVEIGGIAWHHGLAQDYALLVY